MRRIDLATSLAILLAAGVLVVPSLARVQDNSDERNGSSWLKTIATAQADFRSNDRDNNRVQDFWTGDIAGLYCIDNSSVIGRDMPVPIKLIEVQVALADLAPNPGLMVNTTNNYGTVVTSYGKRGAAKGYWFRVLKEDLQWKENGGAGVYMQDTGGAKEAKFNTSRFGATALPASYGKEGTKVFIINEGNTMFKRDFGQDVVKETKDGPALTDKFDANWPKDIDLAGNWGVLKD